MDCKKYTYNVLRQLIFLVCILTMTSCTWVKDDYDCPSGFWLKLSFTTNLLDVDAAPKYVRDADVYIYDADGKYVKHMHVSNEALKANDYRVRVDDLPEGNYQFVVWSGINDDNYFMRSGTENTIDDFRLSLVANMPNNHFKGELPDLFYGYLPALHIDGGYDVREVNLMKDTNKLTCLVVSIDNEAVMNPYDYTMQIITPNGTMNAYNQLVSNIDIVYEPVGMGSVTFEDTEYGNLQGIQYTIPVLRLVNYKNNRIVLMKKDSGQKLFDISLAEYIGMVGKLYTTLGREITVQDYLDRQDFYTVVFYLSDDLERLISLKVNNWFLRSNNHLNL